MPGGHEGPLPEPASGFWSWYLTSYRRSGGKVVALDVIADPGRLLRLNLEVLDRLCARLAPLGARATRLVSWTGIQGDMEIGGKAAIAGPPGRWR
jgi:hypothetical protein